MNDSEDDSAVWLIPEIDTAPPVGKRAQARLNMIARRAGEFDLGNPLNLCRQIGQKGSGIIGAVFGDVVVDATQIAFRGLGEDKCLGHLP